MGNKIHPTNFRLGTIFNWKSRWLSKKFYRYFLEEDLRIREFLKKLYNRSGLGEVEIERSGDSITVIVNTAKPGLIIGRGGTGLTDLKKKIEAIIKKLREKSRYGEGKWEFKLAVNEIKKSKKKIEVAITPKKPSFSAKQADTEGKEAPREIKPTRKRVSFRLPIFHVVLAFLPVGPERIKVIVITAVRPGIAVLVLSPPGIQRFFLKVRAVPIGGTAGFGEKSS